MTNFKRLLEEVLTEKGEKDGPEYKAFFQKALKKFGVDEPDKLADDKKAEFFNYVDKNWKSDAEEAGKDDE
jgi:hypothetical protein